MSMIIPFITLREYDFTNVTTAQSVEVIIVKALDLRKWRRATLEVRVHSKTITNLTATIIVRVRPVSLSQEGPSLIFTDTTTSAVDVTVTQADTAPYLLAADIPFCGGADFARVSILATAGSGPGSIIAALSAQMTVKALV